MKLTKLINNNEISEFYENDLILLRLNRYEDNNIHSLVMFNKVAKHFMAVLCIDKENKNAIFNIFDGKGLKANFEGKAIFNKNLKFVKDGLFKIYNDNIIHKIGIYNNNEKNIEYSIDFYRKELIKEKIFEDGVKHKKIVNKEILTEDFEINKFINKLKEENNYIEKDLLIENFIIDENNQRNIVKFFKNGIVKELREDSNNGISMIFSEDGKLIEYIDNINKNIIEENTINITKSKAFER